MNAKYVAALVMGVSSAALSTAAFAQTTEKDPNTVSDVIVTATRRAESLQTVPLAVTVITGDDFKKSDFKQPFDLQYLSPSVQYSIVGGNGLYIRGAGLASQNAGTEQSVGIVIDGVVIGFVDDLGGDLSDLARVEILRGPQGTSFGKNASAGVASFVTNRPVLNANTLTAHVAYGEHDDTNAYVVGNAGITDTLAARFSLSYLDRAGVFRNVVRNEDEGKREQVSARAKLLWTPSTALDVYFSADARSEHATPNFLQSYRNVGIGYTQRGVTYEPPGLGNVQAGITPSPTNDEIGESGEAYRHTGAGGASVEANYHFGDGYTFTSLTAFRAIYRNYSSPLGSGVPASQFLTQHYYGGQTSQEFRVTSPANAPVRYVAGVYLYDRNTRAVGFTAGNLYGYAPAVYGPGALVASNGGKVTGQNTNKSAAGFVDGTWSVTSKLNLLAGFRYTNDQAEATTRTVVIPGYYPPPGTTVKANDAATFHNDAFTYRFGPQYFFTPQIQGYATYSRGYKGPAADTSQSVIREVLAEYVDNYEAGVKSTLFDRRLTVNLAAFHEHFTNFQTTVLNTNIFPAGFVLGNAGGETSKGFELETQARATSEFSLSFGLTYLDARFTDFRAACYSNRAPIPETVTTNPDGRGGCYTVPGTTVSFTQAKGFALNNASKYNVKLGANYNHDLGGGRMVDGNFGYLWRSDFFTSGYDPNTRVKGYGIATLNVGYGSSDGRWRLGLFARNLFDQYFISAIQSNSSDTGGYTNVLNVEARRTIGVVLDASF